MEELRGSRLLRYSFFLDMVFCFVSLLGLFFVERGGMGDSGVFGF